MTDPYREVREAEGERPGIIYPLLTHAARPDTRLQIDAALPEAAALDRRTRRDCRSFTRSDQEGCGLPLERRMPDRVR